MVPWSSPTSTGGNALPISSTSGEDGVTNNCSNVPSSRSRATLMPASMITWANTIMPKMPGAKYHRVSWFGLNQVRASTERGGRWPVRAASHCCTTRPV